MQGLDKLVVYNIVSEIRKFCSNYGIIIGGGFVDDKTRARENKQNKMLNSELKAFDDEISENFGSISVNHYKRY